jgi:thiamine biosynthesis lipoprotein
MSIIGAPRAVTVAAPTCVEAGVMSTLAMLQGTGCEAFLKQEGMAAWVIR